MTHRATKCFEIEDLGHATSRLRFLVHIRIADLVLLMVDASFGFEMETFEFLNIAQSHGFPKIIGCLSYLDKFKKAKRLKKTKKVMKHRCTL